MAESNTIRDQILTGEVEIDGRRFVNCRLEGVQLRYSGGDLPVFENCEVADNISWYFQGPALRTIQLLQAQNHQGAAQPLIDALFNSNTVSTE